MCGQVEERNRAKRRRVDLVQLLRDCGKKMGLVTGKESIDLPGVFGNVQKRADSCLVEDDNGDRSAEAGEAVHRGK